MNQYAIAFVGAVAIAAAWFFLGWAYGNARCRRWWEDEMIRRRHAVFHWENGKWYWNEDEPQTSRDPAASKVRELKLKSGYGGGATMPQG